MASLNTPQPGAFPCTEITFVAMGTPAFKAMVTGTPDWRQQLEERGFLFLNGVLFDSLGLPLDAQNAYLTLVGRVDVKRDELKKKQHPLMPSFKPLPTFTLSSTPSLVDDGGRFALNPEEALTMMSPVFVAYIKEHWGTVVYPVVGHEKDPNLCIAKVWDEYHSSCFSLP
jgi:hypothetical protein